MIHQKTFNYIYPFNGNLMENIYDIPEYFDFYLWSQDSVYFPFGDQNPDWGWTLGAFPRNPKEKQK